MRMSVMRITDQLLNSQTCETRLSVRWLHVTTFYWGVEWTSLKVKNSCVVISVGIARVLVLHVSAAAQEMLRGSVIFTLKSQLGMNET